MIRNISCFTSNTAFKLTSASLSRTSSYSTICSKVSKPTQSLVWTAHQLRFGHTVAKTNPFKGRPTQTPNLKSKEAPLYSSGTYWLLGGAVVGLAIYAGALFNQPQPALVKVATLASLDASIENMAIAVPPGHLGNLTTEQEEKLRQMWAVMFQIFGISSTDSGTSTPSTIQKTLTANSSVSPDTGSKHKRNRSLFSRKSAGDSTNSNSGASDPSNDKYNLSAAYKTALADMSPSEIRAAFWSMSKHDHPDALLLRFLRARKWDVQAAVVMAISALHWRIKDAKVDSDVMLKGENGMQAFLNSKDPNEKKLGKDFMDQLVMGKSFLYGQDKEGRPCCYVRVRMHKAGEQSEESLERFTVWTIETARLMLIYPVTTATIVFDMTNFGLANMDYAPVKFMIRCFEANYPESLGLVLIHRAPWIFQGIWKVIRGWLDPVVASKIHFTNSAGDLAEFLPQDKILKELGGKNDYVFKFVEAAAGEDEKLGDEKGREALEAKRKGLVVEYEDVVKEWIAPETASVGKDGLTKLREKRSEIATELSANYWELDPYVRARSVYDRLGAIKIPKAVVAKTSGGTGGIDNGTNGPGASKTLAVPVAPSSASIIGRTSTESNDIFVDAVEHLDQLEL